MYAFLSVLLAEVVRNDCLSSTLLSGLSLTPVTTPYTPAGNTTYCSGLISAGSKFCVNDTLFATPVTTQKIAATQTEKSLLANAALSYLTNYNSLLAICATNITTANVGKKINNNVIITQAMVWKCGNLTSVLPTVNTVAATLTSPTGTAFTNCYNFFWSTTNGAFCLLATNSATNFTTVSGNTITLNAGTSVSTRAFTACSSLYFGTCLANDMASFLDTLTGNTTASAVLSANCGNTTTLATCINGTTTCADAVQQSLFSQFFTPSTVTFGSSFPTTLTNSISILQRSTIARLLQTVSNAITVTTVYGASANGYAVDTAVTGLSTNSTNTNVSATDSSNSTKDSRYFVAPFFMALLALLIN